MQERLCICLHKLPAGVRAGHPRSGPASSQQRRINSPLLTRTASELFWVWSCKSFTRFEEGQGHEAGDWGRGCQHKGGKPPSERRLQPFSTRLVPQAHHLPMPSPRPRTTVVCACCP